MKKVVLWQFFTKKDIWLKQHIIDFINSIQQENNNIKTVYDPFAWWWDLLNLWLTLWFSKKKWLDIDKTLKWKINDSLQNIPKIKDSFIITNPPYLWKSSAKRRKIFNDVAIYFNNSEEDDLYKIAIEQLLLLNIPWIAIIPETFINSSFIQKLEIKSKLHSITVLEDNPFTDTDIPVCVICFNWKSKKWVNTKIYKNEKYICDLTNLEKYKMKPLNNIKMSFNDINGKIALIAYDWTSKTKKIHFLHTEDLKYDLNNIKVSSRAISVINIDIETLSKDDYTTIIKNANTLLNNYRDNTQDILLSPFKWNNKEWERRRRLDFKSARYILEQSILQLKKKIWIILIFLI